MPSVNDLAAIEAYVDQALRVAAALEAAGVVAAPVAHE
jgi:hypothetical protein